MSRLRQKTKLEKFFAGEFAFEITIALGALASGVVTCTRLWQATPSHRGLAIFSLTSALIVCVSLITRAVHRRRRAQDTGEHHALDGVLYTLHAILTEQLADNNDGAMRICVFVPGFSPDTFHQITDYVGVDNRSGSGRDLSTRCGVVGKAVRSGSAAYDKLPNDTNLIDHLVNEHSFERDEAVVMKQDRKSWAAIPVGDENDIMAVVYLDSDQRDFLGKTRASSQRKILEAATIGVARFITRM